jgi:hypothetical protein
VRKASAGGIGWRNHGGEVRLLRRWRGGDAAAVACTGEASMAEARENEARGKWGEQVVRVCKVQMARGVE